MFVYTVCMRMRNSLLSANNKMKPESLWKRRRGLRPAFVMALLVASSIKEPFAVAAFGLSTSSISMHRGLIASHHVLSAVSSQDSNDPNPVPLEQVQRTPARHSLAGVTNDQQFLSNTLVPVVLFILQSFLVTLLIVSWEDITCSNTLPSRQTTSLQKSNAWGASTVRGLAFGKTQRLNLVERDELVDLVPSYNEIGLKHRQERVPRWKRNSLVAEPAAIGQAAHTLLDCLETIQNLQDATADYQWETVRRQLRAFPLSQLEPAASTLRSVIDRRGEPGVVGFDWGSCAWRHCGALADAQEAIDEVEHLMGVLEPFEAIFCLDIVERSLRDILTLVPWDQVNRDDAERWKSWPAYIPRTSQNSEDDGGMGSRIDDEYFRALQDFRID